MAVFQQAKERGSGRKTVQGGKKTYLVAEMVTDVKEKQVNSGTMHVPSGEPEKKCIF